MKYKVKVDRNFLINKAKTFIQSDIKHNNVTFPKIKQITAHLEVSTYKTIEILRALQHEGFISRNYNQYHLIEKTNKEEEVNEKKQKNIKLQNIAIITIRIVMGIIGVGAAYMSIYYTTNWLIEFLPFPLAFLLSAIMVLFSIAAFETLIILKKNKQKNLYGIFIFLWIIVLIFSVVSTVAGQYNQRITNEKERITKNTENINKSKMWEIYNNNEEELLQLIQAKEKELSVANNLMSQFDNLKIRKENEKEWLSTLTTKRKAEEKIQEYRSELSKIRQIKIDFLNEQKDEIGIIEETKVQSPAFYDWLAEIINFNSPNLIQFWLSMFPAIFIDIIAPLALAVCMFLEKKKLV